MRIRILKSISFINYLCKFKDNQKKQALSTSSTFYKCLKVSPFLKTLVQRIKSTQWKNNLWNMRKYFKTYIPQEYIQSSEDSTTTKPNNPIKKQAKELNTHFSKEDTEKAHKHRKRCSSLVIQFTSVQSLSSHQVNSNQNHNEILPHTHQNDNYQKLISKQMLAKVSSIWNPCTLLMET